MGSAAPRGGSVILFRCVHDVSCTRGFKCGEHERVVCICGLEAVEYPDGFLWCPPTQGVIVIALRGSNIQSSEVGRVVQHDDS